MAIKQNALFKVELEEGTINEYLFYADGKIEHRYDRSDKIEAVEPSAIDDVTLQLLLEKCPYEFKDKLKEMLSTN